MGKNNLLLYLGWIGLILAIIVLFAMISSYTRDFSVRIMYIIFFVLMLILLVGKEIQNQRRFALINKLEKTPLTSLDNATDGIPIAGEGTIVTVPSKSKNENIYRHYFEITYMLDANLLRSVANKAITSLASKIGYSNLNRFELKRVAKGIENTQYAYGEINVTKDIVEGNDAVIIDKDGNKINVKFQDLNKCSPLTELFLTADILSIITKILSPGSKNYAEIEPSYVVADKKGMEIAIEAGIKSGDNIYYTGVVKKENGELYLTPTNDFPLILSHKDKYKYIEENLKSKEDEETGIFNIIALYIFLFLSASFFMSSQLLLAILYGFSPFILVIVGVYFVRLNNILVRFEESCYNAKYGIDVEYKRRADLIPKIIEVVKGYVKHEKTVLEELSKIRSSLEGNNASSYSILIKFENYPELKASDLFLKLMRQLKDTEDRIAQMRELYNNRVANYNKFVTKFPNSIFVKLAGKSKLEYEQI
ncbi:MAG: LemA family protein [Candidatus Micrarchaeota archaeon]|nr:LemA family protein [Candidatus Micrarchaeota archaeon]